MAHTMRGCFDSVAALEGCMTELMTGPGWQTYVVAVLAVVLMNTIIGYTIALMLDLWWVPLCVRRGWATRTTDRRIKMSTAQLVGWNFIGINAPLIFPTLAGITYVRHVGYVTLAVHPMRLAWVLVVFSLWYDLWYHCAHRVVHRVKWLYRSVHAEHHLVSAMLEARTTLVMSLAEGLLLPGLANGMYVVSYVVYFYEPDFLMILLPLLVGAHVSIAQHVGVDFHSIWAYLATNPLVTPLLITGTMQTPYDHQLHHELPNKNFALIYRHCDDWMGTAAFHSKRAPASPLLMAYNLAFYAGLTLLVQLLPTLSATVLWKLGAVLLLLAVWPAPNSAAWLRAAGFLDVLRQAYGSSSQLTAPLNPNHRYIFCYHSKGAVPPGFWWTFVAQDSGSPVAAAGIRVRAAVNNALLYIPGIRQVVALFGGCSTSQSSLHNVLSLKGSDESVAVCVRTSVPEKGEGELSAEMASLVQLALDTGATLVPVVSSGEEDISSNLLEVVLAPAMRGNIKVMVGSPVLKAAAVGDSQDTTADTDQDRNSHAAGSEVTRLGAAYLTALQQLQKQQGQRQKGVAVVRAAKVHGQ